MLYALYEAGSYAAAPWRMAAQAASSFWSSPLNPARETELARGLYAAFDLVANLTQRRGKPEWGIGSVEIAGQSVGVQPREVWATPWAQLLHFVRDADDLRAAGRTEPEPKVLIVAPLSGHYSTLLRGTVKAFLQDHEVYVADWANARDVALSAGDFGLDDYIDHVRRMLSAIGGRPHVVAVCQPGPAVLAAAALMAEDGDANRPASMTLMGSPIDARRSPMAPNHLATERPFAWFKSNLIYTVPAPYAGAGRRVYPGFIQLAAFLAMNMDRHQDAHWRYLQQLMAGDGDSADKHREFYDEYLAVLDLPETFYLQTVDVVFQRHLLAKGELVHRGRPVRPECITDIALLTVEGENDDISGIGQTQAAHSLCAGLPDALKHDYVQPVVGHYGVFNGARFREEIYPRVRAFIRHVDRLDKR